MSEIKIDATIAETLRNLTMDRFSVDQSGVVDVDGEKIDLTVIQVKSLEKSAAGRNPEFRGPFSVLLRSSPDIVLQQGMYRFNLDGIGEVPMFMVPLGREDDGSIYEVIFN